MGRKVLHLYKKIHKKVRYANHTGLYIFSD